MISGIKRDFVGSLRDQSGLGLRQQPDGTSALDDLLHGVPLVSYSGSKSKSLSGRWSIRAACEMWDRTVVYQTWREILKKELADTSDMSILSDGPRTTLMERPDLEDNLARARDWLAELSALHGAVTDEENLTKLWLVQATKAVNAGGLTLAPPKPLPGHVTDVNAPTNTESSEK